MWCSATFRISKSLDHQKPPNYADIIIRFHSFPVLFSVPVTMPCLFLRLLTYQTTSHIVFIMVPHTYLACCSELLFWPPRQANTTSNEQGQHMTGLWVLRRRRTTHSKLPQSAKVASSLKAGGLQVLVQAALDRGQATYASSNHCHLLGHGALCVKVKKSSVWQYWKRTLDIGLSLGSFTNAKCLLMLTKSSYLLFGWELNHSLI